jgi:hypothetical protein
MQVTVSTGRIYVGEQKNTWDNMMAINKWGVA